MGIIYLILMKNNSSMRNNLSSMFFSKIMMACSLLMILNLESTTAREIRSCNIITDCLYSTTDYNLIVEGFIKGIKSQKNYPLSESCYSSTTVMLDEFNAMAINNTASEDDWEGRMMFLAKLWSNSY